MSTLAQVLNQEIAGAEATLHLSDGESLRIKGDFSLAAEPFIVVSLTNNPDKKGRKMVNVNHIVSIDWYTR